MYMKNYYLSLQIICTVKSLQNNIFGTKKNYYFIEVIYLLINKIFITLERVFIFYKIRKTKTKENIETKITCNAY